MTDAPVDLLASDAVAFDAQYRSGLSNHLPMALVALAGLGASRARIQEFRQRYVQRLEPAPRAPDADPPIERAELAQHLGTHTKYARLAAMFRVLLVDRAPHELVRDALRDLLPGLAGGAFHGLIRLAYAVGTHSAPPEEIAAALAYMADVHLPLAPASTPRTNDLEHRSLLSLLAEAASTPAATGYVGKHGLIFDDLADVASHPTFTGLLDGATHAPRTLDENARAALLSYASTGHFTALHCVTATHALRVLGPLVDDMPSAASVLAGALVTAYITMAAPPLWTTDECDRMRARVVPGWDVVARAACASDNEHVIKIVWTAREEHAVYADPLYAFVAARAAGLVSGDYEHQDRLK